MGLTVWDTLLENVFAETVHGVDCVLSNQWESHTYRISGGNVVSQYVFREDTICDSYGMTHWFYAFPVNSSNGDNHDRSYPSRKKWIRLTPAHLFAEGSPVYNLAIYPSDDYYDAYETRNPRIALIGTLLIMILTSLLFYLYDSFVRKDLVATRDLLEAKRRFMRFVSHEVRTPLNAVCMGLDVITSEIKSVVDSLEKRW